MDTEELRRRLLDEIYAGAFAGFGAMILDEREIRYASDEELREIARRYGINTEPQDFLFGKYK